MNPRQEVLIVKEKPNKEIIADKISGCLLGGAIGDALGYPIEFIRYNEVIEKYGEQGITEYQKENGVALISDDTQMTLFTACGLLNAVTDKKMTKSQKKISKYIYQAYLDWLETQGAKDRYHESRKHTTWIFDIPALHSPRAPGHTCIQALISGKMGRVDRPINYSKGCGGIMRTAPFGLISCFTVDTAFEEACNAAAITHGHVLGWLSAGVQTDIIHRLVFDAQTLPRAIECSLADMMRHYPCEGSKELTAIINKAMGLTKNDLSDIENISNLGSGSTGEEALAIALYANLKYENDFDKIILCAVNHNGDTDSTGAVAGNLIGAITGSTAISDKWKKDLELLDLTMAVAGDLAFLYPEMGELNAVWLEKYYHEP